MNPKSIFIFFLLFNFVSCSSQKVNRFKSIYIEEVKDKSKVQILTGKLEGMNCYQKDFDTYSINLAIKDLGKNIEGYTLVGLSDVLLFHHVEAFMGSFNRCYFIKGNPILVKKND